jgi:trans-2,3-dihydro-3-hydroxyanthranilate isomerase
MRQLQPVLGREVADRAAVAAAAGLEVGDLVDGLPILPISTGIAHLMVPLTDDDALARAVRDERRCLDVCISADDAESLYLFTVRGKGDIRARMFDRFMSIGEDPATGSAAGPLGVYLAMHQLAEMPGNVIVSQGEAVRRPSFLHVEAVRDGDDWLIHVGGGVRPMGEGFFEI